ncbi:MAG: HAD hydrolase-like protein [Halobacteriovoraceae bacterium]|nr:HAD hydrolase-like protein [Halobacteriovoraceae bacterium]
MLDFSQYKFFIFDFDGVILDSNEIKKEAIREAASVRCQGNNLLEFVEFFTANNGIPRETKIKKYFPEIDSYEEVLSRYNAILNKKHQSANLISGIKEFLKFIDGKNTSCYILSGGSLPEIKQALSKYKIEKYFKGVYTGPQTKEENMKSLDVLGKGLYFGDSLVDWEVASASQLDFIFVYGKTQFHDWKEFFKNKKVSFIKDFEELKL